MRFALALCALLLPTLASAQCLNVVGTFKLDETSALQMRQTRCAELSYRYGHIDGGDVSWGQFVRVFLDGRESCAQGICWRGQATRDRITVEVNPPTFAYDDNHGVCWTSKDYYERDSRGQLVQFQQVTDCDDGYEGLIKANMRPMR